MNPEKVERLAKLRKHATAMRRNPTPSEEAFWQLVRKRKFRGHRFRRQVVIDPQIVDFCCHELGLVVEIDGPSHLHRVRRGESRLKNLNWAGFYVFRFGPVQVIKQPGKVWKILEAWYEVNHT